MDKDFLSFRDRRRKAVIFLASYFPGLLCCWLVNFWLTVTGRADRVRDRVRVNVSAVSEGRGRVNVRDHVRHLSIYEGARLAKLATSRPLYRRGLTIAEFYHLKREFTIRDFYHLFSRRLPFFRCAYHRRATVPRLPLAKFTIRK